MNPINRMVDHLCNYSPIFIPQNNNLHLRQFFWEFVKWDLIKISEARGTGLYLDSKFQQIYIPFRVITIFSKRQVAY